MPVISDLAKTYIYITARLYFISPITFSPLFQVDTCNVKRATMLPVAKYFIRDYGKVPMLDSNALMAAVSKGPVALGKYLCFIS